MASPPIFYAEEEVLDMVLAYFVAQPKLADKAMHPRSFLGNLARSIAQLSGALLAAQKQAYYDGIPAYQVDYDGVIRSRASSEALDKWAFIFGLSSNRGAGLYGRNGAVPASGGAGLITGVPALVVPAGEQLTDSSGKVVLELAAEVTLDGGGSGTGTFNAVTGGAAGNLEVGTICRWTAPIAGLQPQVRITTALSGGLDEETDLDLLARLLHRLRFPPRGGTAADIQTWAEEATDSDGKSLGIKRAYVYVHRGGIGSVDVVITQPGTGTGRDPGAAKQTSAQAYIDARRIATDTIRVLRPWYPNNQDIAIRVRVKSGAPQYDFDWDDGGTGLTPVSYAAGLLVVLGGTLPAALKTAVDGGRKPRIQVGIVGHAIPIVRAVTAYAENTPMAGQSRLTLDSALPAGGVQSAAFVWAASSAVELVAQQVLNAVDGYYLLDAEGRPAQWIEGIGPSRQSGYADPLDVWQDRVSIGEIARAALDTKDAAGLRVCSNSYDVGEVTATPGVGVTISIHGATYNARDFVLFDNSATPTDGPQMANVTLVSVTS